MRFCRFILFSFSFCWLFFGLFPGLSAAAPAPAAAAAVVWPPSDWLLHSLLSSVPGHLSRFDSQSGRFQSGNWHVRHQQVIFPLAVAWFYASAGNPYHADESLLGIISQAGIALAESQDSQGKWPASTTAERHLTFPSVCNRWIKTYMIVKEKLTPEAKAVWEKGLQKSFQTIADEMQKNGAGSIDLAAAGLYAAGKCLDKKEWRELSQNRIRRILTLQTAEGFWRETNAEQNTPHLLITLTHMDTLGFYYAQTKDQATEKALERAAQWHLALLWPDGTMATSFDNTMPYRNTRNLGNVGFSWTTQGRAFLLKQTDAENARQQQLDDDYAANMLQFGGQGTGQTKTVANFTSLDRQVQKQQLGSWHVCLSAYTAKPAAQRWILDRQNHLDLYHEQLGAIISGNGKNQPQWSNFNFIDTDAKTANNNKAPAGNNDAGQTPVNNMANPDRWVATAAKITSTAQIAAMELTYGQDTAQFSLASLPDGRLQATYSLPQASSTAVVAQIPLLRRSGYLQLGNGEHWYPDASSRQISGQTAGGWLIWDGLRVEFPADAKLCWPSLPAASVRTFVPDRCRLVISLPFSASIRQQQVTFSAHSTLPPAASSYPALQLPVISPTATSILRQETPGAVLLCATAPGEAMTFALTVPESGTYELLADLMLGTDHGTIQLAINDQTLGNAFDTYAAQRDFSGPLPLGKMPLTKGKKQVKVTVLGKNDSSSQYLAGIKSFFLIKQ